MILAGDIGGTRTRLAAFNVEGSKLQRVVETTYPSQERAGLSEIVAEFVKREGIPVHSACFGVAGPVRGGRSKISNLPWTIDSRELAAQLKLDSVGLINDLEAYAYGVDALESKDLVTLQAGSEDAEGNRAVIAARTGLGVAGLYWDGFRHHPFACEGGHTDFAPRNDLEVELFGYILKKHGHVSTERLLSGPGIKNIYEFLRDINYATETSAILERFKDRDPSSVIANAALAGECDLCLKALDMFAGIYGAVAGNVALQLKAIAGVYVGGGIAPKIIEKLKDGTFMKAFTDKGRLSSLLEAIPVRVIMNDRTALLGSASVAAKQD